MNNFFYTDIEDDLDGLLSRFEEYALRHEQDVFLLKMPKGDDEEYDFNKGFLVLSSNCKISIVNYQLSKDDFDDYYSDVVDNIGYLYKKYKYKEELGRFRDFWDNVYEKDSVKDISKDNLDSFFTKLKLSDAQQKKYANILISLCTGSVNDINRVKANVPKTLLEKVKQKIQLFDADQTRFIYQTLGNKRITIQGLSGTGKTELLLHKLKELYTKDDNSRIFVTCHNRILAESLKTKIPRFFNFMRVSQQIEWNERLWCANAWGRYSEENSGLYRYICSFYNIPFQSYGKNNSFENICKEAIWILKNKKREDFKYAFDYVLVDECQDFPESFFDLCEIITSKQVYRAGDIFQSIFEEHEENEYAADYFLKRCYRTDPKTLMFAQALGLGLFEKNKLKWLNKQDWEACGYFYEEKGNTINLRRIPVKRFQDVDDNYLSVDIQSFSMISVATSVLNIIREIKNDNLDVTENDICIILLDSEDYSYTWANQIESEISKELGWEVNKAYESKIISKDQLLLSNRNNVKGLEYPFVICVTKGLTHSVSDRNALYTMLTRSFIKSYLLISDLQGNNVELLRNKYKQIYETDQLFLNKPTENELKQIEMNFKERIQRRLFKDEVRDILEELGVKDNSTISAHIKYVLDLGWQDLSLDELRNKLKKLVSINRM